VAIWQHRAPSAHDGFQFFTLHYYFLNNAIQSGDVAQWIPYMNHGTIATLWYGVQASMLQQVLLVPAPLFRHADLLTLFHLSMFVDTMVLLVGTWLVARRFFGAPAAFFVTASVVGSCVWLDQPYWNFRLYYALPLVTGFQLDSFTSVGVGLGLHTSAYYCEVIRAGILAVDRGQTDAAKAVGMPQIQTMRRIVLPQAVRFMVPPFMNETANLMKLTTLGSVLAVHELLHAGNNLITNTYRPLEIYTAIAVIFAAIIYPVIWASRQLEKYWSTRS